MTGQITVDLKFPWLFLLHYVGGIYWSCFSFSSFAFVFELHKRPPCFISLGQSYHFTSIIFIGSSLSESHSINSYLRAFPSRTVLNVPLPPFRLTFSSTDIMEPLL